jgi:signal recognition particle receptor subunit beta
MIENNIFETIFSNKELKFMKSPARLREELSNTIDNIKAVRRYLRGKSEEQTAGIGAECLKTAELLDSIVENHKLPDSYKVAVVGRFKAGKSSFVNELLDSKLAGEDTSPETAAVTTFTYGTQVEARINIIGKAAWEDQKKLFQVDPKNVDAHRAKMWNSFSKPRKNAEGFEEKFDLDQIERDLINAETGEIVIHLDPSGGKGAAKAFRDKLKTYTSGNKPFHCLVSSINITTPSTILHGGIELVDTPGLGDTERFRVSLTEQSVENVDAILLLTKSGGAYGQEEKEFLLSILRKGNVKQLMIVVTQVDQTYEQHVKAMRADDVEPEPITARIRLEKQRISDEIKRTLEELSGADSSVTRTYLEQFDNVGIVFTSVQAHRDFKAGDKPGVTLAPSDPGGLIAFSNSLSMILSTESRLTLAAGQILGQSKVALESLAEGLEAKAVAISNTRNGEEVERRLSSFRSKFEEICRGVAVDLNQTFLTFKDSTELRLGQHKNSIENIVLKADKELNKFRTNDVAKHWRTRRSSNWGYMYELQSRVANRIFPGVQEMLESHIEDFSSYVRRHDRKISKLTREAAAVANELELGQLSGFDIKRKLKESTARVIEKTQEQLVAEQEQVLKLLDSFVTQEVEEKISEKRRVVAEIWGRGTSSAQQDEVNDFYDAIEGILSTALSEHVTNRNTSFANGLVRAAEHAPKETFQEINDQLENAIDNLRQAAEMTLDGQREQAERLIKNIVTRVRGTVEGYLELEAHLRTAQTNDEENGSLPMPDLSPVVESLVAGKEEDWAEMLLADSNVLFATFNLKDGETGWPFSRIFDPVIFDGAQKIRIVEPYLIKHHQLRNLKELLLHMVETARPRSVEVVTSHPTLERTEFNKNFFNDLSSEVFKDYGFLLDVTYSEALHDRFIFSDAGYVAKLGRGLDIYKPSTGLAAHRQESRRVRGCDITILRR